METIAAKGVRIAADVQGFVRVARGGVLVYEDWPEKEAVLALVEVLKTDAVEAEGPFQREVGEIEALIRQRYGTLVSG